VDASGWDEKLPLTAPIEDWAADENGDANTKASNFTSRFPGPSPGVPKSVMGDYTKQFAGLHSLATSVLKPRNTDLTAMLSGYSKPLNANLSALAATVMPSVPKSMMGDYTKQFAGLHSLATSVLKPRNTDLTAMLSGYSKPLNANLSALAATVMPSVLKSMMGDYTKQFAGLHSLIRSTGVPASHLLTVAAPWSTISSTADVSIEEQIGIPPFRWNRRTRRALQSYAFTVLFLLWLDIRTSVGDSALGAMIIAMAEDSGTLDCFAAGTAGWVLAGRAYDRITGHTA